MKRTIGFRNFRRFIDFEPIAYDHITYLVGRNNSGKSTVVKALMLVLNYLKTGRLEVFSFADAVLESANIVTYERAKNRLNPQEDFIRFTHGFGIYEVITTVSGEEGKTFGWVRELVIADRDLGIKFTLNPGLRSITLEAERKHYRTLIDVVQVERKPLTRIDRLKEELGNWEGDRLSKEYIELNQELEALKKRKAKVAKSVAEELDETAGFVIHYSYPDHLNIANALKAIMSFSISMTWERYKKLPEHKGRKANELKKGYANYRALHGMSKIINASIDQFFKRLDDTELFYLGASSTKQPALFAIRDRNNTLAQAIHEYQQLGINPGDAANVFIVNWIKEEKGFEIGDDFQITTRAGEAYEVEVSSHGTSIPLSDKGMGSIQAMLLIFRLACIIHKKKKAPDYRPIVIIEEPELNLHPALQSRLTDLFLEVHKTYGIDFIVETHSEYMVRRTQVLVAEGGYAGALGNNPFTVIYFPKDLAQPPYHLVHQEDGTFDKSFGSGFLDEASKHTLELIRMRREKEQK